MEDTDPIVIFVRCVMQFCLQMLVLMLLAAILDLPDLVDEDAEHKKKIALVETPKVPTIPQQHVDLLLNDLPFNEEQQEMLLWVASGLF